MNVEKIKELKERKKYYLENPKGLGSWVLNGLMRIVKKEAEELIEELQERYTFEDCDCHKIKEISIRCEKCLEIEKEIKELREIMK